MLCSKSFSNISNALEHICAFKTTITAELTVYFFHHKLYVFFTFYVLLIYSKLLSKKCKLDHNRNLIWQGQYGFKSNYMYSQ